MRTCQAILLILTPPYPKHGKAGLRKELSQMYLVFSVTRMIHKNWNERLSLWVQINKTHSTLVKENPPGCRNFSCCSLWSLTQLLLPTLKVTTFYAHGQLRWGGGIHIWFWVRDRLLIVHVTYAWYIRGSAMAFQIHSYLSINTTYTHLQPHNKLYKLQKYKTKEVILD